MDGQECFEIQGKSGFVRLELTKVHGFPNHTSHFGGYDAEGTIEIQSGVFHVKDTIWFTTGDVSKFYEGLQTCYAELTGESGFINSDANLEVKVSFEEKGHVAIRGIYHEYNGENELSFVIDSDQSYLPSALRQLAKWVKTYGGASGIR